MEQGVIYTQEQLQASVAVEELARATLSGRSLVVADVNADLKPDLLIADTGVPLQVLLNTRK